MFKENFFFISNFWIIIDSMEKGAPLKFQHHPAPMGLQLPRKTLLIHTRPPLGLPGCTWESLRVMWAGTQSSVTFCPLPHMKVTPLPPSLVSHEALSCPLLVGPAISSQWVGTELELPLQEGIFGVLSALKQLCCLLRNDENTLLSFLQ